MLIAHIVAFSIFAFDAAGIVVIVRRIVLGG
jgi:hypothetical protein